MLSVKLLKLVAGYLTEQNLKQGFPSLCIETFKIILEIGPKTYTKLVNSSLELIILCFEKLFNEKSYKVKDEDTNKNILKIAQMFSTQDTEAIKPKGNRPEENKPEDRVISVFKIYPSFIPRLEKIFSCASNLSKTKFINTPNVPVSTTNFWSCSSSFSRNANTSSSEKRKSILTYTSTST